MRATLLLALLLLSGCALVNSNAVLPSHRSSEYSKKETPKEKSSSKKSPKSTSTKKSTESKETKSTEKKGSASPKKSEVTVLKAAQSYLGVRYKFGGTTRKGLDCSGLIWRVQQDIGNDKAVRLSSSAMYKKGKPVSRSNLKVGDLCFFGPRKKVNHVGIYIGNNRFIHASSSKGVCYSTLDNVYWAPRLIGFRRLY